MGRAGVLVSLPASGSRPRISRRAGTISAGEHFLFCNAGVALLGLTLLQPGRRRIALFSLGAGLPGLAGLVRLATHSFFDLRVGGMERVSAYPFTLWIACMGAWLLLRGGLVA
jgi:hypothetical protein